MDNASYIVDHESKLIRAKVEGSMQTQPGIEFIAAVRREAGEHGYHILHDLRRMDLTASVSEMYNMIKQLPEFKDKKIRSIKAALLIDKTSPNIENLKFYETAGQNEGLQVRLFLSEEDAEGWLSEW